MTEETPISVVLYGSDLMFRSRVGAEARAAGRRMTSAASPGHFGEKLEATQSPLVLVDMDMADAAEAIRIAAAHGGGATIVAYYSHVRDDLREAASAAGAGEVMPRSQFVVRLPDMLRSDAE